MSTMTYKTMDWIKDVLTNDEISSDAELIEHFMQEGGLTEKQAKMWVGRRSEYMGKIDGPKEPDQFEPEEHMDDEDGIVVGGQA